MPLVRKWKRKPVVPRAVTVETRLQLAYKDAPDVLLWDQVDRHNVINGDTITTKLLLNSNGTIHFDVVEW